MNPSLLGFKSHRTLEAYFEHESYNVMKMLDVNRIKLECNLALRSFGNGEVPHHTRILLSGSSEY